MLSRNSLIGTFFFFNDTATTEIYTLSLHDALPIFPGVLAMRLQPERLPDAMHRRLRQTDLGRHRARRPVRRVLRRADRKSTRLNSSHANISYAVFCLKKKNNNTNTLI